MSPPGVAAEARTNGNVIAAMIAPSAERRVHPACPSLSPFLSIWLPRFFSKDHARQYLLVHGQFLDLGLRRRLNNALPPIHVIPTVFLRQEA
jgi:hypothetical protein